VCLENWWLNTPLSLPSIGRQYNELYMQEHLNGNEENNH
jgi:hypothetical protein